MVTFHVFSLLLALVDGTCARNTSCKPVPKKIATSAHFRFRLILHFAIRPNQGVTCQDVIRWVNGKFSYERPGTLGSPLGYTLLPTAAS